MDKRVIRHEMLLGAAALFCFSQSAPSWAADFATRCSDPAVVLCVGFDTQASIAGTYGDNHGILSGASTPQVDTTVKASGTGSLKFTIPSNSGADTSGTYFTNFSSDLSVQFGANQEFFIQWRQRLSPELVSTVYTGGGGWKQAILGTGDKPGQLYASCTETTVVLQNVNHLGFPQLYNSCTGSDSHGAYDPFVEPFTSSAGADFKMQNARPSPYCLYSQGNTNPKTYFPPAGNCFGYFANEWLTYQISIKTGPRVNDEFTNSYVKLWVAREGQTSELVFNFGPYNLTAGAPGDDLKFGKIWLLPYNTDKSASQTHATAYTWYDELVVSRSRIADPDGGQVIKPKPPTSLTAN